MLTIGPSSKAESPKVLPASPSSPRYHFNCVPLTGEDLAPFGEEAQTHALAAVGKFTLLFEKKEGMAHDGRGGGGDVPTTSERPAPARRYKQTF